MTKRSARRVAAAVLTLALAGSVGALPAGAGMDDAEVFVESAIAIDRPSGTVTLPLFEGRHDGDTVWYVVTESSSKKDARRRGVNFSEKMANALGTKAVQRATRRDGRLHFTGTVDFSPERIVVPGPTVFPPAEFQAGAVGDADYSPLVTTNGRVVLNASQVANDSGLHDAVVNIDFENRTVELDTLDGFYEGNRVQYLHQEGSVELVAALEGSTFAPNLNAAPGEGSNDRDTSARSAIIPIVNGRRGADNPQRQGLVSAILGQGDPLNVTQEVPDDRDYSPIWDVSPAVWTERAIDNGRVRRVRDHDDIADLFEEGLITSGGAGVPNDSLEGLRALPGISNCPIIVEFD